MPLSKMPLKLKERFTSNHITLTSLDLSSYPLDSLSFEEISKLNDVLRNMPNLVKLNLANCNLNKLEPYFIERLLIELNQLQIINLDNNELSSSIKQQHAIYLSLGTLPRLLFLSIQDGNNTSVIYNPALLPSLRMFRKDNSNIVSFLTFTEMNTFYHFLNERIDRKEFAKDYFSGDLTPYDDNALSKDLDLLQTKLPIQELYAYRLAGRQLSPQPIPGVTDALAFLDKLKGTGTRMSYCNESNTYTLNVTATNILSIGLILDLYLPAHLKWHFTVSPLLSYFERVILKRIKEKHQNNVTLDHCATLEERISAEIETDVHHLQSLHESFTFDRNNFYNLLNDKEKLYETINFLKKIVASNNRPLQVLACEFFVIHKLTNEINGLPALNEIKDDKNKFGLFKQNLLSLLNPNSAAVSLQLTTSTNSAVEANTNTLPNIDADAANEYARLKAKAWWGKIAVYAINQNSSDGLYWYGRFLHEHPIHFSQESNGEERGLYWIRFAATHYNHLKSYLYLRSLPKKETKSEDKLHPADRYQLQLACEMLQIPKIEGETFVPYTNFSSLFARIPPAIELLHDIGYGAFSILQALSDTKKTNNPNHSKRDVIRNAFYSGGLLRIQSRMYLNFLMRDNLISEQEKLNLIRQLTKNQRLGLFYEFNLKKAQQELILYHAAPLGLQIKSRLLPLLSQNIQPKLNEKLDDKKTMSEHTESLRVHVFCQFIKENLDKYLKDSQLFGTKISPNEHLSYVAALIHELLGQSLKYFELEHTDTAEELNKVMYSIKQEQQDYFFRRQLAIQPASLGFSQSLRQRLASYSTTAYLANTTHLSLLKSFGAAYEEQQKSNRISIKSIANGGAFLIEALHISLPIILAATGVGIPASLGSSAIMTALFAALKKINHHAKEVEEVVEMYHHCIEFLPKALHGYHFAHEAGLIPHGHQHAPKQLVRIDTIKHFNDLLHQSAVYDIDNLLILIKHWASIYQPITDELTETSNSMLGILLIELLMRGLTLRLIAESQAHFNKRSELPKTIPGLLNYFNETLWLYSCPNASDNTQLMTKNSRVFSALEIIFPKKLNVYYAGETIEVTIEPSPLVNKPSYLAVEEAPSRFASTYEVMQINQLKQNSTSPSAAFKLANNGHASFTNQSALEVMIGYQERNTIVNDISFLYESIALMRINSVLASRLEILQNISGKLNLTSSQQKQITLFSSHLRRLHLVIENSLFKLDNPHAAVPNTLDTLQQFKLLNHELSPEVAIKTFIEQVTAFCILLIRKYKPEIEDIETVALASMDNEHLKSLANKLIELTNTHLNLSASGAKISFFPSQPQMPYAETAVVPEAQSSLENF